MSTKLNVTALFAGIGGMELGLHQHGHRTSLMCESDNEASAVLRERFPTIRLNGDVRDTEALRDDTDPASDLLTAGFPCTDLSQAGRTQGFSGPASSLVRKVFDLLDARSFPRILIENVPNWRILHGGQYMTEVLDALERRGYRWAYRVIDARAFGLPQRRLRVFLYASQEEDPTSILFHGNEEPLERAFALQEAAHGFYWTEGNKGLGWGENCVPTLKGGSSIGIPAAPAILLQNGDIVTPDMRDGERLQGFESGWTDHRGAADLPNGKRFNQRKRWMLIGNAVNVRVSSWIGAHLASPTPWQEQEGTPLAEGSKWPVAAWFDGTRRRRAELSSWPVHLPQQDLGTFLRHPGHPLSLRATSGFYGRIIKSPLRISSEFKSALALHLNRMEKQAEQPLLAAAE